ncbi:MAG: magnesium-translocating P-type ATPase [Candidatus Kerfeldbacteria bacterium RIFCSPLOWO2_01_FULL_48_11]|uniref:Magnesium-transporting ATPase, P-type 1 n=1 Tax=Candidatus Kerfeldbacteria bacterium RIFCSPLOWO2_01_FULL_48_11 TaxID=1798543 RepID=A0A1G2B6A1_9BACT|nr:MAG: Mg2+-importing ATPase [Parcubacteria group bacterium GW2011_GWC2_49_9]OGY84672.1 MAG: magnesium-translocating P-type ATPase [Candidatus Kerfeldbacteria bacterium RIFCSPLOWO2_01_FULL_48_11]
MASDLTTFSATSIPSIFQKLQTRKDGLTEHEIGLRLQQYGKNVLSERKEVGVIAEYFSHFKNPLAIILLFAAGISAYLGEIKNLIVIAIMVVASVTLDFVEEHSANNAAKKLKEKVSVTATVIRGGKKQEIRATEICPGDVIFLSSGDLVPADARIIEADDFFVNQSALTGESFPKEKFPIPHGGSQDRAVETDTLVFLGTSVISGTALAVVFHTGPSTEFGKIASSVLQKEEKSDFELGITKFGFFLMKVIIVLVLCIFLGNALIKRDFLESFIFAIAIAVGITPELLPVIMSVTMARASQKMAKSGVIVKKLSAIPNFGSMDILCTDKTGTLTEGNIKLVTYTDTFGKHNESVFLHTYLNSFHQTGVKNPLDKAVLAYKHEAIGAYTKIEEIPFDFARKMMSVAVTGPEGRVLITKGAPEAVISNCSHYTQVRDVKVLSSEMRENAFTYYEKLSSEGYRVLAIAIKTNLPKKEKYTTADEEHLTLIGFVSFLDPAKQDADDILRKLQSHGIEIKIITGDNEQVTEKICRDIGLQVRGVLLGKDITALTDDALAIRAEQTTIFARFSPDEKNRVISAIRKHGHVVGYMGDGINDAPSLKAADVGISVDHAVDVAKEAADIILTHKSLAPIAVGVIEGRRSFGNTMKYVMMAISSNFGNMFSVFGAIFYLPFLPMLPIQILLNNFIYDFSQVTIPSDKVDSEWVRKPRKWDLSFVRKFMYIFGPISSVFDFLTFFVLFSVFKLGESAFQTGWFLESLATQTLVIHVIRTKRIPFIQSRPSKFLLATTLTAISVGWVLPYTPIGRIFKFTPLPLHIIATIIGLVVAYLIVVEVVKKLYYRKNEF